MATKPQGEQSSEWFTLVKSWGNFSLRLWTFKVIPLDIKKTSKYGVYKLINKDR